MHYSTIALIYNPNSTGNGKDLAEKLKAELKVLIPKQKVELIATTHAGHAEELTYKFAKTLKRPLIISSSGDGGYNEVVNGAMRAKTEGGHAIVGVLPAGNANDHHRNVTTAETTATLIADARHQTIDVLKMNGRSQGKPLERYAHSYIGLGLTPKVGSELNKTDLNVFKEIWLVARTLFSIHPVKLVIDGRARHYDSVIFSNIGSMSKVLKLSKEASVVDGKFEVTVFRTRQRLKLIGMLLKASVVGIVQDKQAKTYDLETIRKTLVQADGEILVLDDHSKLTITCVPTALDCIV